MKPSGFHWKFFLRGLILAILLLATAGLAGFLWLHWNATPPELVSLPPARSASTDHPDHSKGLRFLSSGFLLQVDGQLYAVTAAHSLIDFRGQGMPTVIPIISLGGSGLSLQIETEGGDWGRPRLGRDLRVDYALFVVNQTIDPEWILHPDSRGKAEIGERVWLNSGVGDGSDVYVGTVYSSKDRGVWAVMDEQFGPWMMSGSPFISAETKQVVGMAIAMGQQDGHLLIGMHPIGSLVKNITDTLP